MGIENGTNKFKEIDGYGVVKVESGAPFHISKDLLGPIQDVDDNLSIVGSVELELKGFGPGILEILSDEAAYNESLRRERFGDEDKVLIKTPGGPIVVGKTYIDDDIEYIEDDKDPPLRFVLYLGDHTEEDSFTQEQIDRIVFEMEINNKTFQGIPHIEVRDETNEDAYETEVDYLDFNEKGTVQFNTFKDPVSGEVCCPFIENDDKEIEKVEFTIYF